MTTILEFLSITGTCSGQKILQPVQSTGSNKEEENKVDFPSTLLTFDRNFYMDKLVRRVASPQAAIGCYKSW